MDAKIYLKDYIKKTSPILKKFLKEQEKQAAQISSITAEMMKVYFVFMGGKNIRGALTKLGYECFGGKNKKAILEASLVIEITHAWILMHDDIVDQDYLRRSQPTIHIQFERWHKRNYKKGDPRHFGTSMAIDLGDVGFALSHILLADTNFLPKIKERVLRRLDGQILTTAWGQAMDLDYEHRLKVTEEDVMKVHRYKTANYTITGPLQYGALFAGASEKEVKKIEKYGLPVGIAFQLRDDELGIFSEEDKLGKPVGSDIRENKNTLLHIKSLEWATPKDRNFLESTYGNRNITRKDVLEVRRITEKTGALAYSQKLSRELVEKGKKHISKITSDLELQDTLYKMADFMIERES